MTRKNTRALRSKASLVALAAFVAWGGSAAEASWFMDAERFHVSAHGQMPCLECHGDIPQRQPHPDARNVNKSLREFFRAEQCEECHVEAFEGIDEGTHGGTTDKSREEMAYCIGCHEPHYASTASARKAGVDLSVPAEQKCSACHEYRDLLPEFSEEDERCMGCHLRPESNDPKAAGRVSGFCFHCHGGGDAGEAAPRPPGMARIDPEEYASTPHHEVSCLVCHPAAAQYGHAEQVPGDCLDCHVRHDEKVANAAHLRVSCGACHLEGVRPLKDATSGTVRWRIDRKPGQVSRVHHMVRAGDEEACRRCHTPGNSLGAAAMVLPAKSLICMPCHPSTLSIGDTTTVVALLILLLGLVGVGSVWMSGSLSAGVERRGENRFAGIAKGILGAVFSLRLFSILKALVLDGLFQRRLLRQDEVRWAIHALIFFPFLFRFVWGLVGLVASLYRPDWQGTWVLLDKNHPVTAFLFDLTGVMVILGVACAVLRRAGRPSGKKLPGLPKPDWPANGLLAGIVLVGFLLEGMRIAMTGSPHGAELAFVGHGLSRLLNGSGVTGWYGYVWYAHAILTGAFVAYLPFSRMIHMITVPISLALNAGAKHGNGSSMIRCSRECGNP